LSTPEPKPPPPDATKGNRYHQPNPPPRGKHHTPSITHAPKGRSAPTKTRHHHAPPLPKLPPRPGAHYRPRPSSVNFALPRLWALVATNACYHPTRHHPPPPARPPRSAPRGSPSLFSTNRVATRFHVGDHKREACSPLREHPPLFQAHASGGRNHTVGGGTIMSRPLPGRPPPIRHTPPRTRQNRPHQSVNTQTSKPGQERRDHTAPPPPSKRTQASTQTPQTNTPNPHHPPNEQTRPQQAPLPPPRKHKSAHATARGQARRVSAGTRGSRATDQNEAQTTRRGHADSAHKKRANNVVCAVCACARKGRTAREKVGHA
jgi:hypothetical protein